MNILRDVAVELYSMFLADVGLSAAILVLVTGVGLAIAGLGLNPGVAGVALVAGCLAIIAAVTTREARQRRP